MKRLLCRLLFLLLASGGAIAEYSSLNYTNLIETPRWSSLSVNKAGNYTIFVERQYSLSAHRFTTELRLVNNDLPSSSERLLDGSSLKEATFLDSYSEHFLLLRANTSHSTSLWIGDIHKLRIDPLQYVGTIPGNINNIKSKKLVTSNEDGKSTLLLAFTGWANPDGSLVSGNEAQAQDSGRVYDSQFVRHWDYWLDDNRMAIFGVNLTVDIKGQTFKLSSSVTNLIDTRDLESPVAPDFSASDFDISQHYAIVFNAKAPELNPALNTATYIYYKELNSSDDAIALNAAGHGKQLGAASGPVFSPDGESVAYLQRRLNGFESDKNIVMIYNLVTYTSKEFAQDWELSPSRIVWSSDGASLLLITSCRGREALFELAINQNDEDALPLLASNDLSLSEVVSLKDGSLIVAGSKITAPLVVNSLSNDVSGQGMMSSSELVTIDPPNGAIDPERVDEFNYTGARGHEVHGFIVYPHGFDPNRKYPLAFLIHGGPEGAWMDSWSTRWNPIAWADAESPSGGWIVILINPTGSTGYGQDFVNSILGNWGGLPFIDLKLGFEYVLRTYPFIDPNRAIAAGASYGGYMINYIQGTEFGRQFKALVCHDGLFNTQSFGVDELYFIKSEFGGWPWTNKSGYLAFDPSMKVSNWATPQLIIHSAYDFRLPVSEGVAAFNALQIQGVPSRLLFFPDENHFVLNPENSRRWHEEVFKWINHWVSSSSSDDDNANDYASSKKPQPSQLLTTQDTGKRWLVGRIAPFIPFFW